MTAGTTHRVPLTREHIVEAALAIVDTDGAESLTMRKLVAGSLSASLTAR